MARSRHRVQRTFLLLLALCVLVLLLEMNRFFPGTWPGGGGARPARVAELPPADVPPPPPQDPGVVAPPEAPPPAWPPPDGLEVLVRGPEGTLETRWRFGYGGGGGGALPPDSRGRLRTRDVKRLAEGFRIRTDAGVLWHVNGTDAPAATWVVHAPPGTLPRQRDPGRAGIRVVDAATGAPLEGATVAYDAMGLSQDASSDATGEAVVRGEGDGRPLRVRVTAPGYAEAAAWARPRSGTPTTVRLRALHTLRITGRSLGPYRRLVGVRLLAADGRELWRGDAPIEGLAPGAEHTFEATAAGADLEGAWLETRVRGALKGPAFTVRTPLDVERPSAWAGESRSVTLRVRDARGVGVAHARAVARYVVHGGSHPESELAAGESMASTDGEGLGHLLVPAGTEVTLQVTTPDGRPVVRRLTATDGSDTLEFVVEAGLRVPVRVRTPEGEPLAGARVVVRASIGGVRFTHEGRTGPDGRAEVGPFGVGPVEVFATAAGRVWQARLAEAAAGMGTVEVSLEPGHPLLVIVEDPHGVPLSDVAVTVTPAGSRPLVSAPDGAAWVTDERGRFAMEHLPNGLYAVGLSRPGYGAQTLRRVQPGAVTYFATLLAE